MVEGESIHLGGNIELSGFSELKSGEMTVVKKIVGNYVRKLEGACTQFNGLKLNLKPLHKTGDTIKKFELYAKLMDGGNVLPASIVEHNLFVGLDSVLKKLEHEIKN